MNIRMIRAIGFTASFNIFNRDQRVKSCSSKPCTDASWPSKTVYMGKFTVVGHNIKQNSP